MTTPYDTAIRHQAYIEGVKDYNAEAFDPTNEALVVLLATLLGKWGYDNIGDMPKRELRSFVAEFNRRADRLLATFNNEFMETLRDLANIDAIIIWQNGKHYTSKRVAKPKGAKLFKQFTGEYATGTGMTPTHIVKSFLTSTKNKIVGLVRQAYADKMTAGEVLSALRGTKEAAFKDGVMRRIFNEWNTTQQTLIQSLHQWLNHSVGRLFHQYYQWVSILDNVTTPVCRRRNGNIYQYGKGPIPPAHWNCRSSIVGLSGVEAYPSQTFYSWMKGQPFAIQSDIVGTAMASKMQAGKSKSTDLSQFNNRNKIKPANLGKFQPRMVQ